MASVAFAAIAALVVSNRRTSNMPNFESSIRDTVEVHMECDGDTFSLRVDPWIVSVRPGQRLRWTFHGPAGATMRIRPDDAANWPFPGLPPQAPERAGRAIDAGRMNRGAAGGSTHKYSILLHCDGRDFDIDPDIYVWV